jgi:hypothetical protein
VQCFWQADVEIVPKTNKRLPTFVNGHEDQNCGSSSRDVYALLKKRQFLNKHYGVNFFSKVN